MKKIELYIPFILVAVAGVAAVYYFWYKPQKDAAAAVNTAAQANYDKSITDYTSAYGKTLGANPLAAVATTTINKSITGSIIGSHLQALLHAN